VYVPHTTAAVMINGVRRIPMWLPIWKALRSLIPLKGRTARGRVTPFPHEIGRGGGEPDNFCGARVTGAGTLAGHFFSANLTARASDGCRSSGGRRS